MTHRHFAALTAFAFVVVLAGCGDGEYDVYNLPLPRSPFAVTDSSTYQMTGTGGDAAEVVSVTYTNLFSYPIFYARCTPGTQAPMYDVVRAGVDSGVPLFREEVPACVGGVSTGKLEGGESVTFPVSFTSMAESGVPMAERSGTMQILVRACLRHRADSDNCDPLDPEFRHSNEFTLLPPPTDISSE